MDTLVIGNAMISRPGKVDLPREPAQLFSCADLSLVPDHPGSSTKAL
jgi:hypothetical protein